MRRDEFSRAGLSHRCDDSRKTTLLKQVCVPTLQDVAGSAGLVPQTSTCLEVQLLSIAQQASA
jgi:hypothetical protein